MEYDLGSSFLEMSFLMVLKCLLRISQLYPERFYQDPVWLGLNLASGAPATCSIAMLQTLLTNITCARCLVQNLPLSMVSEKCVSDGHQDYRPDEETGAHICITPTSFHHVAWLDGVLSEAQTNLIFRFPSQKARSVQEASLRAVWQGTPGFLTEMPGDSCLIGIKEGGAKMLKAICITFHLRLRKYSSSVSNK